MATAARVGRVRVERGVGGEDGVAAIDEARRAWLELVRLRHEAHRDLVARGAVAIKEVRREAVRLDQVPRHVP